MPSSPRSVRTLDPHGVRLLGKAIALVALTCLAAHGCERGKPSAVAPAAMAPKPAQPKSDVPPPPSTVQPGAAQPKPASPADSTRPADADTSGMPKPADDKPAAPAPPKLKPIPHDDRPQDAKAPTEFNVPLGVVVQEFKKGDGFPTLPKAIVKIHFIVHLKDGWKKLQSTYDDGVPVEYAFDDMVEGMSDGIAGMQPGGMRRIVVPPSRAFGVTGVKDKEGKFVIPPGATLVYDVDLISTRQRLVEDGPAAAQSPPKFSAIRRDNAEGQK